MAVLNKHKLPNKEIPAGAVYIGRGSKWGNPFVMSDRIFLNLGRLFISHQLMYSDIRDEFSDDPCLYY